MREIEHDNKYKAHKCNFVPSYTGKLFNNVISMIMNTTGTYTSNTVPGMVPGTGKSKQTMRIIV